MLYGITGPHDVLKFARRLITPIAAYTLEAPCLSGGVPVSPLAAADQFNLYGAIMHAPASAPDRREALHLAAFNLPDRSSRKASTAVLSAAEELKHDEALAVLDAAISQADRERRAAFPIDERTVKYRPTSGTPHRLSERS